MDMYKYYEALQSPRQMMLRKEFDAALKKHGETVIRDEIDEMIYGDLANIAKEAAEYYGFNDLHELASRVYHLGDYPGNGS